MSSQFTIAVIGGGSVATSFLAQWVRAAEKEGIKGFRVLLFEPSETPGPGEAYGDDVPTNLLNTRADTMSALPDDPFDFLGWLEAERHQWIEQFPDVTVDAASFMPRPLFGRYLENLYRSSVALASQSGNSVTHVRAKVTAVQPVDDTYEVSAAERQWTADAVVLCLGNLPATNYRELDGNPRFFNSPYPCRELVRRIKPGSSVGVLGTSLSAVDTVVALSEYSGASKAICVSRSGRLPSVRADTVVRHTPVILTRHNVKEIAERSGGQLSLDQVAMLLMDELERLDTQSSWIREIFGTTREAGAQVSWEVKLALNSERPWQTVLYSTNAVIDLIWHYLSTEDKHRFCNYFRRDWLRYRVSFPLANAKRMKKLLEEESVTLLGGLQSVEYDQLSGKFMIYTRDGRTGLEMCVKTDYIVNATGYSADIGQCEVPLLRHLRQRQLCAEDPFGGVKVIFDSCEVLRPDGVAQSGLFALGSLTTGTFFFTNAMDVNTRLAGQVVKKLMDAVKDRGIELARLSQDKPRRTEEASLSLT